MGTEDALAIYHEALKYDRNNADIHFNLGMLATDDDNVFEAEVWFRQAIKLKEDFRSALFNLALLLADQQRPLDALVPLQQLHHHHPMHIKGLILLGDIYTNHKRDLDGAEECYKKILEIDPHHVQGQHNLCVVHVERGNYIEGKTCLEKALSLAPGEQYIRNHLNIVKNKIAQLDINKV